MNCLALMICHGHASEGYLRFEKIERVAVVQKFKCLYNIDTYVSNL